MAGVANSLITVQTPFKFSVQLVTTGLSYVTAKAGATNGTKIVALIATSQEATSRDIQIAITTSSVDYVLATVPVPANAGFNNSVPPVDLLGAMVGLPIDNDGQRYILLSGTGDVLRVKSLTSTTNPINFNCWGGDF